MRVIHVEGLGQHMSTVEYRTIQKYQLTIPLFPADEPCPVCDKVCLDSFGEIAILKEKEEEKERLNGIIAELESEKEKRKAEKEAMSNRMSKIVDMLKTLIRK
ncbi:hypothetical protein R6Q57_008595 [Mikania cordata]